MGYLFAPRYRDKFLQLNLRAVGLLFKAKDGHQGKLDTSYTGEDSS
jgi:hypothetical protein